jgi:heat shock protein HslJ
MRFKTLCLILVVVVCAVPVFAQEAGTNQIAFNGFSFSFPSSIGNNVNIWQYPGDSVDVQQPGGPEAPKTEFDVYAEVPPPPSFSSPAIVTVYSTANFTGYTEQEASFQKLQTLLAERPDLSSFMVASQDGSVDLSFLPPLPATQVVRARAAYVDLPTIQGISYVTAYRQDVSPFTSNSFTYTFQGISRDNAHYVSAQFLLDTALFPAEIPADTDMDALAAGFTDYLNESIATLNAATPDDFTPSLTVLDSVIQSFAFDATGEAAPVPTLEATEVVNTDPTLGGLAGTWNLVSFGPADAPQAVLPEAPITLRFAADGVSGNAGCNSYFGSFQFSAGSLTIGTLGSTMMACAENILAQETAYLQALQAATSYQVSGNQLLINYEGGVMTFNAPPTLTGTNWTLVSFGSADAPQMVQPPGAITLSFTPEGIGGQGGCNSYFGTAQYDAATITFTGVGSTLMACEPQELMTQETTYLGALSTATSYQLVNGQLQITYADGVLTFTPAA